MDYTPNSTRVQDRTIVVPNDTSFVLGQAPDFLDQTSLFDSTLGSDEGAVLNLNPLRKTSPDKKDFDHPTKCKLLKCSNLLKVSTFNVRTLNGKSQFSELVNSMSSNFIDIIAVQEHRIVHQDEVLRYSSKSSFQLVTSSATKNSVNAAVGGVGFLLSAKAFSNLTKIESINERIMIAEFSSNPVLTVVCAYSPHNSAPEEEVEEFYLSLRNLLNDIPNHNFLSVAGDFNAKLAEPDVRFSFNNTTNRNGNLLVDFLEEYNLFSSNNHFQKCRNQLWTFEYPNGSRAQIDYILFRKKWKNSIKDSRSYSSFSSVSSDHRIVSSKIRLSLRSTKPAKPNPFKRIDWQETSSNFIIRDNFTLEVYNRFSALFNEDLNKDNVEQAYSHLISATEEVALEQLPKKKKIKNLDSCNSTSIVEARKNLKTASSLYQAAPTRKRKANLEQAKQKLDNAYLDAEVLYINGCMTSMSQNFSDNNHRDAWKLVRDLSNKSSKSTIQLKGGSSKKRLENWLSHFKNLLGKTPILPGNKTLPREQISPELNIPTGSFSLKELESALLETKSNKAFGTDNIPPIIWKDKNFRNLLLKLCNIALDDNICTSHWLKSNIIPVPKKGDLTLATNYRGISLLPIAAKIYNKLLLNRIRPLVDPILRKNQNGFRSGRSTLSQILVLRRILEEARNYNLEAILVFVDFKKAFDSVDRDTMFDILSLYGIPQKIIDAIKLLYTDTKASVQTPDGETDTFPILAGILQGDTLAPFLFILVVDYVMRISVDKSYDRGFLLEDRRGPRHPATYLTDTDFADDIALISSTIANAQSLLNSLESAANCVGLYLNESKTEYLTLNESDPTNSINTISGIALKRVEDYKYLGSYISSSEKDFKVRKALAWSACNRLNKIWSSHSIDSKLKVKIFQSAVEPILLYGSETWSLTKQLEKQLDGNYTRLLRRVKNIS